MNNPMFNHKLHGIPCIRIGTSGQQASIATQGAQVLSWIDGNGRERLYLSPTTLSLDFAQGPHAFGPAIRGGIPICFPQFSDRGPLMKHGFVRNRIWNLNEGSPNETAASMAFAELHFEDDEASRAKWPHRFKAITRIEIHPGQLSIRLQVRNTGATPFSFTAALHTYLRVEDIRQTFLSGLQGVTFEDATKACELAVQQEELLYLRNEVDRVYLAPPDELYMHENGQASLRIAQQGFSETVVWNPGPAKAKALADFPDEDWLHMLCVEAACAARPVELPPGQLWTGSQILTVP
ncbi:MAG: D-hexose-6-phosphate mutarotase [Burkholderiaceae bacterium]